MSVSMAEWSWPPCPFILNASSIWLTIAVTGRDTPYSLAAAKAMPKSL